MDSFVRFVTTAGRFPKLIKSRPKWPFNQWRKGVDLHAKKSHIRYWPISQGSNLIWLPWLVRYPQTAAVESISPAPEALLPLSETRETDKFLSESSSYSQTIQIAALGRAKVCFVFPCTHYDAEISRCGHTCTRSQRLDTKVELKSASYDGNSESVDSRRPLKRGRRRGICGWGAASIPAISRNSARAAPTAAAAASRHWPDSPGVKGSRGCGSVRRE